MCTAPSLERQVPAARVLRNELGDGRAAHLVEGGRVELRRDVLPDAVRAQALWEQRVAAEDPQRPPHHPGHTGGVSREAPGEQPGEGTQVATRTRNSQERRRSSSAASPRAKTSVRM